MNDTQAPTWEQVAVRKIIELAVWSAYEMMITAAKPKSHDHLRANGELNAYCKVLTTVYQFGRTPWAAQDAIMFAVNKAPNCPVYGKPGEKHPRIDWLDRIVAHVHEQVSR